MRLVRYAEDPELRERRNLSELTFPEFMHHNEPGDRWWSSLYERFPAFQLALLDGDELVAEGTPSCALGRLRGRSAARLGRHVRARHDERRTGLGAFGARWTGMRFPDDGTYVFPGALAPLEVRNGIGRHVEPNVWVRHPL
jgi:hypothetical protein